MNAAIYATRREAQPLIKLLKAKRVSTDSAFEVFRPCCGARGIFIVISGMGAEAAGNACRYAVETLGAARIVNAGVAGSLSGAALPGEICVAGYVGNEQMEGLSVKSRSGFADHLRVIRLVTVGEPVFGGERRTVLSASYDLVDMEGYAVAEECARTGVEVVFVKGVTDMADEEGRQALHKRIDEVSLDIAEVVLSGLGIVRPKGAFRRFCDFVKVEHTVFSLPLLFAGAWLGAGRALPPARIILLVGLAGLGARALGMAVNRIFDRDIDAMNPRTSNREIPSGQMSVLQGYLVAAAGLSVYLAACLGLGPICFYLSPIPVIPLVVYALLKRFTPLCHYGIGVCLAFAPVGAYVAASGRLPAGADVYLLSGFAFFWISGFDIIYALQDEEFDRRAGVRSLPAAVGSLWAQAVSGAGALCAMCLLFLLWKNGGYGFVSGLALMVAAAAYIAAYLPVVPLAVRFFPVSAVAGIAGAMVVMFSNWK